LGRSQPSTAMRGNQSAKFLDLRFRPWREEKLS
jgi:hypothetical protein